MASFIEQLAPEFAGGEIPAFAPGVKYYPNMDYLIYKQEAGSYRADRVDAFLTVLWHPTEDRLIGVKLKSWRLLLQKVAAAFDLKPEFEFPLVKALEFALAEEFAKEVMTNFDGRSPSERYRRAQLYSEAIHMTYPVRVSKRDWLQIAA